MELNGFINTVVYAWQSGFLRRTQARLRYMVNAQDEAVNLPAEVSYDVAFASYAEVMSIEGQTANANAQASMEAKTLIHGSNQTSLKSKSGSFNSLQGKSGDRHAGSGPQSMKSSMVSSMVSSIASSWTSEPKSP